MKTWNTIARSRRREWARKRKPARWGPFGFGVETYRGKAPEGAAEILRLALGDRANYPEGPPYTHTLYPPYEPPRLVAGFLVDPRDAGYLLMGIWPRWVNLRHVPTPKTGDGDE